MSFSQFFFHNPSYDNIIIIILYSHPKTWKEANFNLKELEQAQALYLVGYHFNSMWHHHVGVPPFLNSPGLINPGLTYWNELNMLTCWNIHPNSCLLGRPPSIIYLSIMLIYKSGQAMAILLVPRGGHLEQNNSRMDPVANPWEPGLAPKTTATIWRYKNWINDDKYVEMTNL